MIPFRYVVLANMLAKSEISPFDSREAKVFQEDPEIVAMARLRVAYEKKQMKEADRLINDPSCRYNPPSLACFRAERVLQLWLHYIQYFYTDSPVLSKISNHSIIFSKAFNCCRGQIFNFSPVMKDRNRLRFVLGCCLGF